MRTLLKCGTLLTAAALNVSYVQAAEVELVDTFNISMNSHGLDSYNESFKVAVDNLSPTKEVFIHREKADGSWVDIPMYYAGPAGGEKEYWQTSDTHKDNGAKFVVGMKVGDITYWDNNNGQDYALLGAGYSLGQGKKVVAHGIYESADQVRVKIVVDNLAASKDVKLIYTTDHWQSSSEVSAQYDGERVYVGYGSYENPNANNAESWTAIAPVASDESGEFYLAYTVNGQTYYDNNYGANYQLNPNYASLHNSMNLRVGPNWGAGTPMTLVADNEWAVNINVTSLDEGFKFDAYNDWTVNFGDNNQDGFAEQNASNIPAPLALGRYHVSFNEITGAYYFQAFGVAD